MFANLANALPLLSVAALLIASVNTIGYFTRVGLHFLGLMDISNLIYSFGLAFTLLSAFATLGYLAYPARWAKFLSSDPRRIRLWVVVDSFVVLLSSVPIVWNLFVPAAPIGNNYVWMSIVGIEATLATIVTALLSYHVRGDVGDHSRLAIPFAVLLTSYAIGMAQADYAAFGTNTFYTITDKHGFDRIVRLVRTSSAGVLVSSDQKIVFVPKEEIRQIEADPPFSVVK